MILLLRRYFDNIERVFERFEKEGGRDLVVARQEGPDAVRKLLMSREWESLRAVKKAVANIPPVGLRRSRG